jgi:hypothetical protein
LWAILMTLFGAHMLGSKALVLGTVWSLLDVNLSRNDVANTFWKCVHFVLLCMLFLCFCICRGTRALPRVRTHTHDVASLAQEPAWTAWRRGACVEQETPTKDNNFCAHQGAQADNKSLQGVHHCSNTHTHSTTNHTQIHMHTCMASRATGVWQCLERINFEPTDVHAHGAKNKQR